jgi:hypothetical protein
MKYIELIEIIDGYKPYGGSLTINDRYKLKEIKEYNYYSLQVAIKNDIYLNIYEWGYEKDIEYREKKLKELGI